MLLAVALTGIAHVAFLPPFEGFDETGHFSYIQQIADQGRIPRAGIDRISADLDAYRGPRPYTHVPPFENNGGSTYKTYFAADLPGPLMPIDRAYAPGRGLNGEAQHPPLYYLLLAPLYWLGHGWSWPALLLLLRTASWGLAVAGFAIGCRATQRQLRAFDTPAPLLLLVPAWPFLFPQFFPEMARLGNDSLCLLLMGIGWALLPRFLERKAAKDVLLMGAILGLGLLTKAFFLPIDAGLALLFAYMALSRRDWHMARAGAAAIGLAAAIGGGWYLYKLISLGSLIGSNDMLNAARQGNLMGRIVADFSPGGFLQGMGQVAVSFAWAGSWSFGRFPPIFALPVILLALLPALAWLRRLRHLPVEAAAPLFIVGPFLLGLAYYRLTQMTLLGGGAGTPGWYLHILAGPLTLALVLGWRWRFGLSVLAIYALGFHAAVWAMQLSLFSGCAYKAGAYKYTQLDWSGCFIVPSRLAVLGYPLLGGIALLAGLVLAAGTTIWFYRQRTGPAVLAT
ncbi:MAG TPA: hypothetical protein VN821_08025 [Candidatus Udaeobacter sp.]|nr:hypothetical protein [Candidatus Udaeobacter sp.]